MRYRLYPSDRPGRPLPALLLRWALGLLAFVHLGASGAFGSSDLSRLEEAIRMDDREVVAELLEKLDGRRFEIAACEGSASTFRWMVGRLSAMPEEKRRIQPPRSVWECVGLLGDPALAKTLLRWLPRGDWNLAAGEKAVDNGAYFLLARPLGEQSLLRESLASGQLEVAELLFGESRPDRLADALEDHVGELLEAGADAEVMPAFDLGLRYWSGGERSRVFYAAVVARNLEISRRLVDLGTALPRVKTSRYTTTGGVGWWKPQSHWNRATALRELFEERAVELSRVLFNQEGYEKEGADLLKDAFYFTGESPDATPEHRDLFRLLLADAVPGLTEEAARGLERGEVAAAVLRLFWTSRPVPARTVDGVVQENPPIVYSPAEIVSPLPAMAPEDEKGLLQAVDYEDRAGVALLLAAGEDPNRCSSFKGCPIFKAANDSSYGIMQQLYRYGAADEARDPSGRRPSHLYWAGLKKHKKSFTIPGPFHEYRISVRLPKRLEADCKKLEGGPVWSTTCTAGDYQVRVEAEPPPLWWTLGPLRWVRPELEPRQLEVTTESFVTPGGAARWEAEVSGSKEHFHYAVRVRGPETLQQHTLGLAEHVFAEVSARPPPSLRHTVLAWSVVVVLLLVFGFGTVGLVRWIAARRAAAPREAARHGAAPRREPVSTPPPVPAPPTVEIRTDPPPAVRAAARPTTPPPPEPVPGPAPASNPAPASDSAPGEEPGPRVEEPELVFLESRGMPGALRRLSLRAGIERGPDKAAGVLALAFAALGAVAFVLLVQLTQGTVAHQKDEIEAGVKGSVAYLPVLFALLSLTWAVLAFYLAHCYAELQRFTSRTFSFSAGTLILGLLIPGINVMVAWVALADMWPLDQDLRVAGSDALPADSSKLLPSAWLYLTLLSQLSLGWFLYNFVPGAFVLGQESSSATHQAAVLMACTLGIWAFLGHRLAGRLADQLARRRVWAAEVEEDPAKEPALGRWVQPGRKSSNLGAAALGFAFLAWLALQSVVNAFFSPWSPLLSIGIAQVALLLAGLGAASLRQVPLQEMIPAGDRRFTTLIAATAVGFSLPFLTRFVISGMMAWFQLEVPERDELARVEVLPVALLTLTAVLLAPVIEEIVFRGVVYESIESSFGRLSAVIGSAAIFGLVHLHLLQSSVTLLIGLVLGFVRWRTGGIFAAVALHMGNNLSVHVLGRNLEKPELLDPWTPVAVVVLVLGLGWILAPSGQGARTLEKTVGTLNAGRERRAEARRARKPWKRPTVDSLLKRGFENLVGALKDLWPRVHGLRGLPWGGILVSAAIFVCLWRCGAALLDFGQRAPLGIESFVAACFYGILAGLLYLGQRFRILVLAVPMLLMTVGGFRFDWMRAATYWYTDEPISGPIYTFSVALTVPSMLLVAGCVAAFLGARAAFPGRRPSERSAP